MRPRFLLLLAVTPASVLLAQSRPPAAADPLTGTWSGYIGQSEANPAAAVAELKLAPDGTVSGTLTGPKLMPGDVKVGTFDRATGALKLTIVIRNAAGDRGGDVSFDGRVAHDTASGTMRLGEQTGVFKFTKGPPRPPGQVASGDAKAAARLAGDPGAAIRRSFVEVSDWIVRAAELVPADKYSYRPTPAVRTFGQLVGHVVDGSKYYCGRADGKNVQWSDATEKGGASKAALVQALRQAMTACTAAYDGASQVGPLVENVGHSSLHYGNMVTYIRMLGLVPPSS